MGEAAFGSRDSRRRFAEAARTASPRLWYRGDQRARCHQEVARSSGSNAFNARSPAIIRIRILARRNSGSSTAMLLRSSKPLQANIAASAARGTPPNEPRPELRDALDLDVLLPHFRGFLSLIERKAPSAPQRRGAPDGLAGPADSWIATSAKIDWRQGGTDEPPAGTSHKIFSRAFLQPYAEFSRRGRHGFLCR